MMKVNIKLAVVLSGCVLLFFLIAILLWYFRPVPPVRIEGQMAPSASTTYASENIPSDLPDKQALTKLATKAIRDAGLSDGKAAGVTLRETLPDGSFKVSVFLDSGREVPGRLWKDRGRYKLTVDRFSILDRRPSY